VTHAEAASALLALRTVRLFEAAVQAHALVLRRHCFGRTDDAGELALRREHRRPSRKASDMFAGYGRHRIPSDSSWVFRDLGSVSAGRVDHLAAQQINGRGPVRTPRPDHPEHRSVKNFQDTLDVREWAGAGVSLNGFAPPEEGFVWQMGRWGEIAFDFDDLTRNRTGMADLMLELDVFKHGSEFPGQNVFIYLNGLRVGSFYITHRRILIMNFPVNILRPKNNMLTLDTPDAAPARNFGLNDTRTLGAAVFAVYFRREH
jgi:hypothetical protein